MKRTILSLIVLASMLLGMVSSASAESTASPAADQVIMGQTEVVVVRLYYTSHDDLNNLAAKYDVMNVNQEQGYAVVILTQDEFNSLQQAGYRMEIDEGKTRLLNQPRQVLPGQGPDSIPGYPCYRTVEETYTSMENIALEHDNLAQLIYIGESWDMATPGGNPGYDIRALRLTNESEEFGLIDAKPAFFLMAEIHAREYATAELAMRYAEYLIDNYGTDPDITWLLDYFRVYIVTMTNPDGRKIAEGGEWWRKNVDNDDGCDDPSSWGTDLNRNHTFKWNMGGSDDWPCGETYHGPEAGSEPEVQAIESFILTLLPDQRGPGDKDPAPLDTTGVMISLHSAASLVLWPWGWTGSPPPNSEGLQTLGRHLAYFNGYTPQQSYQLYQTSGTSDEFAYGVLGIPAFTFEMAGEFFQPCNPFENTDVPDNIQALLYAFKTARTPYIVSAGPDTLDASALPGAANPGDLVELTATADGTRYAGGQQTGNIAAAYYSIDNPPWITDTISSTMQASDGSFNSRIEDVQATFDTTGLTSGRHTIYVESMDTNGNLGVTDSAFLYIVEPGVSPVIEGHVLDAVSNQPVAAEVTAGMFTATTDPATGYYSMTVISGSYNMIAEAVDFAPAYAEVDAQDGEIIHQDFLLYPTCTTFYDDVENGNIGWTIQSPWAITAEDSHSPTHSWTDSPGGNYGNNRNISITSPTFDFSDATGVTVDFWHKYQTEAGYDFGYVEYNIGGNEWTVAATYDGFQSSWVEEQVSIPGLDGQSTGKIRFHFTSDYYANEDGWHVDDIKIIAGGPGCLPPAEPEADFTSNSPVNLGQPVDFTNLTTGSEPISYTWDFGDGIGISNEVDPSYTYTDTGNYIVTLVAINELGTDDVTHTVTVEPGAITSVDFTRATTDTVYNGDPVEFIADLFPDNAIKPFDYTIDFDDGTVVTGTLDQEPLFFYHVFAAGGSYAVKISVKNAFMSEPVSDILDVYVNYELFLPLTSK